MKSVVTWLWHGPRAFEPRYVSVCARMVKAHLPEPHRFICVTDFHPSQFDGDVEVVPMPREARSLIDLQNPCGPKFPSSYPRLWTFSQEARAILGDRVLLLDVDVIIVRDMRPLFRLEQDFVGWRVRPPPGGPSRFGGGTWLHTPGTRPLVWERFYGCPERAISLALAAGYVGSDQAWISYCLSTVEASWPEPSGIYCAQDYRKAWVRAQQPQRQMRIRAGSRYRRAALLRIQEIESRAQPRPKPPPLQVPADAIVLHMNGNAKPWNSDDDVIVKHWRPFAC